jgi:hypothetical protein
MKTGSKKAGARFFALFAIVGCAGSLSAQVWQPITEVFGPDSVVTTGRITYAEYSWAMGGCDAMNGVGPLVRNGTDFSFDFDYEMETGVACPDDITSESATVVLGALAPGAYTLTTTSWGVPVMTTNFTVPIISTPMLQPIGFSNSGAFQIQLNGVANVSYVLQCSTNLVNWTSLSTNSVGQPLTDTASVLPGRRFYRAQIPRTVFLGPGLPVTLVPGTRLAAGR